MKKVVNEVTGIAEGLIMAKVVSVSANTKLANNDKQTPYRLGTAEVTYPDGTKGTVGALLWEASREANPDSFTAGQEIELRVQLEGEYAGNAIMGLPSLAKVDLTKFGAVANAVANVEHVEAK